MYQSKWYENQTFSAVWCNLVFCLSLIFNYNRNYFHHTCSPFHKSKTSIPIYLSSKNVPPYRYISFKLQTPPSNLDFSNLGFASIGQLGGQVMHFTFKIITLEQTFKIILTWLPFEYLRNFRYFSSNPAHYQEHCKSLNCSRHRLENLWNVLLLHRTLFTFRFQVN